MAKKPEESPHDLLWVKVTERGYSRGSAIHGPGARLQLPRYVVEFEEEQHKDDPHVVRLAADEVKALTGVEALHADTAAAAVPTVRSVGPEPTVLSDPAPVVGNGDGTVPRASEDDAPAAKGAK